MTVAQPEAQRLADIAACGRGEMEESDRLRIAAELRRLHVESETLEFRLALARSRCEEFRATINTIRSNLDWDGQGYYLPTWCVKERQFGDEFTPEPTMDEFIRAIMSRSSKEQA